MPNVTEIDGPPERKSCENIEFSDYDPTDLQIQVKLGRGLPWHRKAIGGIHTACGREIPDGRNGYPDGFDLRREAYRGGICLDECFSPFELARSVDASR